MRGDTQKQILDYLTKNKGSWKSKADIADAIGKSGGAVHSALQSDALKDVKRKQDGVGPRAPYLYRIG